MLGIDGVGGTGYLQLAYAADNLIDGAVVQRLRHAPNFLSAGGNVN